MCCKDVLQPLPQSRAIPSGGPCPLEWPRTLGMGSAEMGLLLLVLLVLLAMVTGCQRSAKPDPVLAPPPLTSLRLLLVHPASFTQPVAADRALAATQMVLAALESQQPSVIVLDTEGSIQQFGEPARCLLEPAFKPSCLSVFPGVARLEVWTGPQQLAFKFTRDGEGAPRVLPDVPLSIDVAELGRILMNQLELPHSLAPAAGADLAEPLNGVCFDAAALAPVGRGLRDLGQARALTGQAWAKGVREATVALEQALTPAASVLVKATFAAVRLDAGDASGALAALPTPLPRHCGYAEALMVRGLALWARGDTLEAAADLARSVRQRPFNPEPLAYWAEVLQEEGRQEDAVQVWRRVVALAPWNLLYRQQLAAALVDLERMSEARAVLKEGLEHNQTAEERANLAFDLGFVAEQEEAWHRAVLAYQHGLALLGSQGDPSLRARLLNGLGVAFQGMEQPDVALKVLKEAVDVRRIRLVPGLRTRQIELANSLYNLGVAQASLGHWQAAERHMKEAANTYGGEEGADTGLDLSRLLQQGSETDPALRVLGELKDAVERAPLKIPSGGTTGSIRASGSTDVGNSPTGRVVPFKMKSMASSALPIHPAESFGVEVPGASALKLNQAQWAEWWYLQGLALGDAARFSAAGEALEAAAHGFETLEMVLEAGLAWYNLGAMEARRGAHAPAVRAFREARAAALALGDNDSVLEIESELRRLDLETGVGG